MEPSTQPHRRARWPWVLALAILVPCCGPVGLIEWRKKEPQAFCRAVTVGEPVADVLSRAPAHQLRVTRAGARKEGPGTHYLERTLAPFCAFLCIVEHDGTKVTRALPAMGGLCT